MFNSFTFVTRLTVPLLAALLPFPLANAQSPSLFDVADAAQFDITQFNHFGGGVASFSASGDAIHVVNWMVRSSDPAGARNSFFIPMKGSSDGKYFILKGVTVSGWLELDTGTKVNGISVDMLSDVIAPGSSARTLVGKYFS